MATSPLLILPTMVGDLERIEARLHASVESDQAFLTDLASHLISAGGKRIRPGFAIAAAATGHDATRPVADEVIGGAVAVELVHIGSLYHDDVMDDADTRRNVTSVNAKFGNHRAILGGDYLLAKASGIAASLGVEVAGLLADTIGALCEGQILELQAQFDVDRTEGDYLASISGKTASLLATACRTGGIVGDLPRDHIDTLTEFGHSYGMAFQIVDDVLDVVATEQAVGKPTGNDILEGIYTLPVIRALKNGPGDEIRSLLREGITDTERDHVRELVRASTGVHDAMDMARSYADKAVAALEPLPASEALDALRAAADHLVGKVTAPIA